MFRLTEFIVRGQDSAPILYTTLPFQNVERAYYVANDYLPNHASTGLRSVESLEVICLGNENVGTTRGLLILRLTSPIVQVRSGKLLLASADPRLHFHRLVRPEMKRGSGSLMEEWEARIRKAEYFMGRRTLILNSRSKLIAALPIIRRAGGCAWNTFLGTGLLCYLNGIGAMVFSSLLKSYFRKLGPTVGASAVCVGPTQPPTHDLWMSDRCLPDMALLALQ
jgi:hypothetical protein